MRHITAALVLFSMPAAASDIRASELSLGGVASGVTEASVLELLGEPVERIETGEGTELRYPGLAVTVGWLDQAAPGVERRVFALRADGNSACTPSGLCPGMDEARTTELYGATEALVTDTATLFEYQPEAIHCWLQVEVQGGTIVSLAVACQS
ncbi:hypothetical protein [Arenimonas terrae]|uniref:Uncharacterized protein n=1 Tax=Arenimonas terrae TaxID=2546226 RepID=A0A5C4RR33_9GAMM|nr:hypothetical protein [Arenimonas terrae]TNJ33424.1 hypothetical protein E1B00_08640 [Arenimonas terrae]